MCDFHFMDAPHSADGVFQESGATTGPQLGWWIAGEGSGVRPSQSVVAHGIEESYERALQVCEESGPFDGLLCFSQGCAMASYLVARAGERAVKKGGLAICVAGFLPRDEGIKSAITDQAPLELRSLVVWGSNDRLVSRERVGDFSKIFSEPSWYEHPGGHGIPSDSKLRAAVKDFALGNSPW